MKSFQSTNNRLAAIEGKRGMGIVRLTFADGSTRGIKVAHDFHLTLFIHVCSKLRCYPPEPPPGVPVDPETPLPRPEPATPSDQLIDLLGEAVSIEGEHIRFLKTITGMCQQLSERKKTKRKTNERGNT
jgi:hypothetical protein